MVKGIKLNINKNNVPNKTISNEPKYDIELYRKWS